MNISYSAKQLSLLGTNCQPLGREFCLCLSLLIQHALELLDLVAVLKTKGHVACTQCTGLIMDALLCWC